MQTNKKPLFAEAAANKNLYVIYNNSISKKHLNNKLEPLEIFNEKQWKSADGKSAYPSFEEWLKNGLYPATGTQKVIIFVLAVVIII